jgi:hypothetical protein
MWFYKHETRAELDVTSMEESAGRFRQQLTKLRDLRKLGAWQAMDTKVKEFQATLPLIQVSSVCELNR